MPRLMNRRGFRDSPELPTQLGFPDLDKLAGELARLAEERNAADKELAEQREERIRAEAADREAYAKTIRAGQAAPKTRKVSAVEEKIARLEERIEAIESARDMAEDELVDLVEANRKQWIATVDERMADQRPAYVEAVDKVAELGAALDTLRALREWLGLFPREGRNRFIVARRGEQQLEQLRHAHDPPKPQIKPQPNWPLSLPGGLESAQARAREAAEAAEAEAS